MVDPGQAPSHHVRTVASAEDYPLPRLADPVNDRTVPSVATPPRYPMSIANLFKPNADGTTL
jgi:hypothetical protein